MREGFFKSVKNFFNSKPSPPSHTQKQSPKPQVSRVVNFGGKEESALKKQALEQYIDTRYDNIQTTETWKDLAIKKNQIAEGEIPIFVDTKFVRSRTIYGQYEDVVFILSDYQIFLKLNNELIRFPLGKIEKLHKYTTNQNHYKLLIGLKDGRLFKFRIKTQPMLKKIYDFIEKFAFIRVKQQFFAFKHFQANRQLEEIYKGWSTYNLVNQFKRMGVNLMPHTEDPVTEYWSDFKILDNRDGRICPTYPQQIIVPSRISYDCLVRCAKFRSRNRMPALSYIYKLQDKYAGIYRSSQSKVGVSNSRSPEDELMLRLIGDPQSQFKDPNNQISNCIIYDARNKMAAFGNKVAGKGYESQQFYPNCKVQFLNIPNIHAVRQSYNKAQKAALGEDSRFYINLAQSQWYDFVFLIIQGANHICRTITQGKNVLVHCSDGWDRTSQLCAIAQILLDPYYRTMVGFQNLIEKDWIRFGHQFALRMGQGVNNPTGQQKSPVFLQFLDCISQLLYQYPTDFQFNYRYLQQLAELSQTNLFGNFLCNNEQQIKDYNIETKTVSMWSYFLKNKETFINPYYFESHQKLHPSSAQKHFRFWKQHFLQYVSQFQDIYDIYSCKFTQDNLQIMYKQLKHQKNLLQEKLNENKHILGQINEEISMLNDQQQKLEPEKTI